MQMQHYRGCERSAAVGARRLVCALVLIVAGGCQSGGSQPAAPEHTTPEGRERISQTDTALTFVKSDKSEQIVLQAPKLVYELAVLHVLVPHAEEAAAAKIWNFLREDGLDAEAQQRLRQNGLRVGVGHTQWWEPIKAALDAIDDHRVTFATPLRVPVGFPLSLELDPQPREQTLFYVGADGILSGGTWPDSRDVLRVSYTPDPHNIDNVVVLVVPEVHQQQSGWEWVRTESGLWEVPRQAKQAFEAAGFTLTLSPGEFALIAPSENARIYGLLGGAFLTRQCEGRNYDSYVFLRPEARQVGQHD